MRAEYNIKEKRKLRFVVDEQTELLKVKDEEIENLKAQLLLKEAENAEAIRLHAEASKFKAIEKSLQDEVKILRDHNTTLEKEKSELDVKVVDLAASVKVHELETSSAGLQEKVTAYEDCMGKLEEFQDERMRVVDDKFNNLYADFVEISLHLEDKFYPHLLTTIAGRRWLLTYDMKLAIIKCLHSPEYLSALGVAISKGIEKGIQDGLATGITHGLERRVLKDVVAFNPSAESDYISALQELQDVNFSLLAELKSALRDVFVPLVEPLSSVALEGTEGTSGTTPDTTTTLSVTFAFVSSIPPILIDDYKVVHADGQEGVGADANPFPNVDGAELNIQ
ncbi:hypothetical protein Tco_1523037 [Tanacetum coccineum]